MRIIAGHLGPEDWNVNAKYYRFQDAGLGVLRRAAHHCLPGAWHKWIRRCEADKGRYEIPKGGLACRSGLDRGSRHYESDPAYFLGNNLHDSPKGLYAVGNNTVASPFAVPPALGYGQNYFEGDMLELLIFDQDLTDNERTTVNEYLRKKYNL